MRVTLPTSSRLLLLTVIAVVVCFGLLPRGAISFAQEASGTIKGRVVFEWDAPVAGAEVVVSELGTSAVTGSDGSFTISGIPHGVYTLVARTDSNVLVTKPEVVLEGDEVFVLLRDNGPNLAVNPWFDEIDEETGLPLYWTRFAGVMGETMWITDEDAYEGQYSLKGYHYTNRAVGIRSQRFAVQPGETYELTAWVKTIDLDPTEVEGGWLESRAWIGIETWPNETTIATADRKWAHVNARAPEWTQLRVTFTVPDGQYYANAFLFTFQNNTRGIMYWNAPRLVKVD